MRLVERLAAIVAALPDGAAVTLPADAVRAWLAEEPASAMPRPVDTPPQPVGWREKLWTCPDAVRLSVPELAEALDRSPDWVYRATSPKRAIAHGRAPLPCRKLDGVLVFEAGPVRAWLQTSEQIVNPEAPRLRVARRVW
jgi:hypothetical protein